MEAHIQDVETHTLMAALAAKEAGRRFRDESQQQVGRIAELEGLLVNRDQTIQTVVSQVGSLLEKFQDLQAELEALTAGNELHPRVVWDSAEWAGFREDVAFSISTKVCNDIMEECGGDASMYLALLEKKRVGQVVVVWENMFS